MKIKVIYNNSTESLDEFDPLEELYHEVDVEIEIDNGSKYRDVFYCVDETEEASVVDSICSILEEKMNLQFECLEEFIDDFCKKYNIKLESKKISDLDDGVNIYTFSCDDSAFAKEKKNV